MKGLVAFTPKNKPTLKCHHQLGGQAMLPNIGFVETLKPLEITIGDLKRTIEDVNGRVVFLRTNPETGNMEYRTSATQSRCKFCGEKRHMYL